MDGSHHYLPQFFGFTVQTCMPIFLIIIQVSNHNYFNNQVKGNKEKLKGCFLKLQAQTVLPKTTTVCCNDKRL